jgi:hypothetical protein
MAKTFPTDVLEQAKIVLDAWKQINQEMTLGDLNPALLAKNIEDAGKIEANIANLETQLINMRNQRQVSFTAVWDKVKRARAGVKAIYGDDSSQYEMIGGTRLSERKSPTRQPVS